MLHLEAITTLFFADSHLACSDFLVWSIVVVLLQLHLNNCQ